MFNIIINDNKPIVLIDCSYYIFHRYHATATWFKHTKRNIQPEELSQEFLLAFEDHFKKDIVKIEKKFKTNSKNMYMCIDCLRADIWRNELIDNYKGHRIHNKNFNRDIFDIFKNNINKNITQVQFDNLEADDVIAIIHKEIRNRIPNKDIVIITNDNDYIQLNDAFTQIVNMNKFNDICQRNKEETIEKYLMMKCLLGDVSDNIPKIPNINKRIANELCKSQDSLEQWLNNNNQAETYKRNMNIICFDNIPLHLSRNASTQLQFI